MGLAQHQKWTGQPEQALPGAGCQDLQGAAMLIEGARHIRLLLDFFFILGGEVDLFILLCI